MNSDTETNCRNVRHITSNFRMFGFDKEMALFQSIKELVENSLDAIEGKEAQIDINIKPSSTADACVLEVLDNGMGITDIPQALGQYTAA